MFRDPFIFFRWGLAVFVTVYATIVTVQQLWEWLVWLRQPDRYIGMLRQYVLVHSLRLRVRAFGGDVLVCVGLCAAFGLMWKGQRDLDAAVATLREVHQLEADAADGNE